MTAGSGASTFHWPTEREVEAMVLVHPASKQTQSGRVLLEARSRPEIFRQTCAVVFDLAPRWGDEGAVIVLTGPFANPR